MTQGRQITSLGLSLSLFLNKERKNYFKAHKYENNFPTSSPSFSSPSLFFGNLYIYFAWQGKTQISGLFYSLCFIQICSKQNSSSMKIPNMLGSDCSSECWYSKSSQSFAFNIFPWIILLCQDLQLMTALQVASQSVGEGCVCVGRLISCQKSF